MIVVALFFLPCDTVLVDHVDTIELNSFYDDETGTHTFDQYIFWDYDTDGNPRVVAWRFIKCGHLERRRDRKWMLVWRDGNRYRAVHGDTFKRTWTTHDPELENRRELATNQRRGLIRMPKD